MDRAAIPSMVALARRAESLEFTFLGFESFFSNISRERIEWGGTDWTFCVSERFKNDLLDIGNGVNLDDNRLCEVC
ncbi:MAG: hypothetical protein EA366_09795 [Spirulina sp. DLM2.Bin59]|nr:MAG: hypothetical protein EA366_09795 [Spirulina sp. DLM2.Bin59]